MCLHITCPDIPRELGSRKLVPHRRNISHVSSFALLHADHIALAIVNQAISFFSFGESCQTFSVSSHLSRVSPSFLEIVQLAACCRELDHLTGASLVCRSLLRLYHRLLRVEKRSCGMFHLHRLTLCILRQHTARAFAVLPIPPLPHLATPAMMHLKIMFVDVALTGHVAAIGDCSGLQTEQKAKCGSSRLQERSWDLTTREKRFQHSLD